MEINSLNIKPGDALVVCTEGEHITAHEINDIKTQLYMAFPHVTVIVTRHPISIIKQHCIEEDY